MNKVTYEIPPAALRGRRGLQWAGLLLLVAASAVAVLYFGQPLSRVLLAGAVAASGLLFGVNTVTYETPVTGVTAPTAVQADTHQVVSATITGDAAATTFTITHNWGLSAADLAAGFAHIEFEPLLAAFYGANPFVASKTANTVVFTCVAFAGVAFRVKVKRPWSPLR